MPFGSSATHAGRWSLSQVHPDSLPAYLPTWRQAQGARGRCSEGNLCSLPTPTVTHLQATEAVCAVQHCEGVHRYTTGAILSSAEPTQWWRSFCTMRCVVQGNAWWGLGGLSGGDKMPGVGCAGDARWRWGWWMSGVEGVRRGSSHAHGADQLPGHTPLARLLVEVAR